MYQRASFSTIVIRAAAALLLAVSFFQARVAPAVRAAIPANAILVTEGGATSGACGDTWASACGLSYALSIAVSGDQVWVAAGTYRPDSTGLTDPRAATFQLKSGVAVYGGFDTADSDFSQRDWNANVVTLSGDLAGDDAGFTNNGENSYHVVTGAHDAALDGVTIIGGNANGSHPHYYGGGMYNDTSYTLTLTNVTISGNSATYGGGMINIISSTTLTLTNVTISGNSATQDGGGMYNSSSHPKLTNVTISGNTAAQDGGGMYNNGSSPTLTNVTISGNRGGYSSGMHNSYGGSPQVRNSIVWGNNGDAIYNEAGSTPTVSNSIVQGGYAGGTNIIAADPQFVSPVPSPAPSTGGNLRLLPSSPAIDAGDNAFVPAGVNTDRDGYPRKVNYKNVGIATVDMGAYEAQEAGARIYVDADAPAGAQDGAAWGSAFRSLQSALAAATRTHEIWVAAGVYRPGAAGSRDATFQLKNGVAIYGGFAGGESALSQRDWSANVVTLSGDLAGDDAGFTHNGENSYHVVTGANGATLDGVTIIGGNANDTGWPNHSGGGILNYGTSPMLTNITIRGNSANNYGGGMFNVENGSPTLTNITISGNSATSNGGGISNYENSSPMLTNVTISGNTAPFGGGMNNNGSSPTLTNITISGNAATTNGGGIYSWNNSDPQVRNSILWGDSGGEIINDENSTTTVTSSIVQGGYAGAIVADPLLAALGNYGGPTQTFALLPGSAAIDAGNGATCAAKDARGVARPQGAGCDMGAFESRGFQLGSLTGTPQAATVNTTFAAPLRLTVTANAAGEPVSGGRVTFTAPSSGASATISGSPATIGAGGAAQVSATANATVGAYTVTASTKGSASAAFYLTNKAKAFRSFLPVVRK